MTQDGSIQRACPAQDRISELPVEVRLHILKMLPRKYAIRTSVLSSAWKNMWKQRYHHPTVLTFCRSTQTAEDQIQFAYQIQKDITFHGDWKIEEFNLYFYPGKQHEAITADWVGQAVQNRVEVLHLDFSQASMGLYPCKQVARRAKKFEMKEKLFKSNESVAALRLTYCRLERYFKFKYFGSLQHLCLRQVNVNDYMLQKLVLNCQSLEYLELTQCSCLKNIHVPDTLVRLRKLIVEDCRSSASTAVFAPSLQSFYFFGRFPDSFLTTCMPLLTDVIIVSPLKNPWHAMNYRAKTLLWLDQVQLLTLCSMGLQVMFGLGNKITLVLKHLKELRLIMDTMYCLDNTNVCCFFDYCKVPLIEKLFIELPTSATYYDVGIYVRSNLSIPNIHFPNLKIIKTNNFKGHSNEMRLLDYFLWSAINLEYIIIVLDRAFAVPGLQMETYLKEIFMGQSRSSANAQLRVLYAHNDDSGFKAEQSYLIPESQ